MTNLLPLTVLSSITALDSTATGWTLLDAPADGPRRYRAEVAFERAFSEPPVVQVAIAGMDVSNEANLRIHVRALDITVHRFIVEVETWCNTKIWAVDVSWIAIGG